MRTLIISLAAAASALAFATPAAAQYYPQPQGNAYGHQGNYGQVRSLQVRIDAVQRQIANFDRRNIISDREARRLRDDSRQLERRLRGSSRYGLNPRERQDVEVRLARLEQRLFRDARDGNRWGRNDYNQGSYDRDRDGRDDRWEGDRDRDGRDDRYEDDRGRDHD